MRLFSRKEEHQIETGTLEDLRRQRLEIDRQIDDLKQQKKIVAMEIDARVLEEQAAMDPGQVVRLGQ